MNKHVVKTRETPIRAAVLEALKKSNKPLSAVELIDACNKLGEHPNKTTIYRQLDALLEKSLINEVRFFDRSVRYELAHAGEHHHHLVCLKCGRIEDIVFPSDLKQHEALIAKKTKFRVEHHALEFYGVCKNCVK